MNTYIDEGLIIGNWYNGTGSAVVSGQVVNLGGIYGIAVTDIASAAYGALYVSGAHKLTKLSTDTFTAGQILYWDSGNSRLTETVTAGGIIGVCQGIYGNGTTTAIVLINRGAGGEGGLTAAVVAQTQHALTDNGGGTADQTVASQAAPTTLTDSSGYSGTHGDTVAAMAAIVTVTDSTGYSATHGDTLAAVAAIVTITDSTTLNATHDDTIASALRTDGTMGGTADGALETVGATNGGDVSAAIMNNFKECQAAIAILTQNDSDLGQKLIELVTRDAVHAQNVSNLGQKVIELVTREAVAAQNISNLTEKVIELVTLAGTAQNNLKEVTTELATIKTDVAAILTSLKNAGIMASS